MIIDRGNFKNQEKQLKRYNYERQRLEKILNHIRQCNSFEALKYNPISIMYGFEALKYNMNGQYSFRLSKNGGVIRLIFTIDEKNNIVKLLNITMNHYQDFKRNERIE